MTGLPQAVIFDQRPDGLEIYAEAGKESQQRRFHDREPVGYAVLETHLQRGFHQPERYVRYKSTFADGTLRIQACLGRADFARNFSEFLRDGKP